MLRDQFLLLSMKSNEEDNYILFCERVSSDVLEGVTSKIFFGVQASRPPFYDEVFYGTYLSSHWCRYVKSKSIQLSNGLLCLCPPIRFRCLWACLVWEKEFMPSSKSFLNWVVQYTRPYLRHPCLFQFDLMLLRQ